MWKIIRFWNNLKRGYELTKLTWNFCWCDHSEATDLFLYGLRRVVNHLEKHKNHEGWEYTVSRGRLIIRLAERVFGETYSYEYQEIMDAMWGKVTSYWEEPEGEGKYKTSLFNPKRPVAITETQKRQCAEDESRLFHESQEKQAKANRIFYKLLEHRLKYLWD